MAKVDIWIKGEVVDYLLYLKGENQIKDCVYMIVKQGYTNAYYPQCIKNFARRISASNVTTNPTGYGAPSSYYWPECPKNCHCYSKSSNFLETLISEEPRELEGIKKEKEPLKEILKIKNLKAIPRNFDKHDYGYGIALSWNPLKSEYLKYYQIQWSKDKKKWDDYEGMREADHGPGVYIHGDIIHKENGKKYTNCLPSGQKFYFRVRALDINGEPITQWSAIKEGIVHKYRIGLPEIKIETDLPAKKFMFVADNDLRKIVKRDYDEIRRIKDSGAFKAIMVMCGSVMEALLFDALIQKRKNAMSTTSAQKIMAQHNHKKKIEDFTLEDCINVAYELGILKDVPLERYPDDLRKYRNFIHALNEKKKEYKIGKEKANIAINALKLIIKSISSNLKK